VDAKSIPDPDATKPGDWDEDAPYEILDDEAQKPEGWLDNEPLNIPDPGGSFQAFALRGSLIHIQIPRSPKSGMTRKMVTGSGLRFPTPSVTKPLVAASGSGNKITPLLLLPTLTLLFAVHTSRIRFIRANGSLP
jgi:hypothetical protein